MVDFTTPRAIAATAQARQQLYADGKHAEIGPPGKGLPKDEAGNFIASQEKSDVVHDSPGLPGGKNAGDEQTKAAGDRDCGGKQLNQLARISIITFRTSSILSDLMRPVLYRIILPSAVNIRFGLILLIF